MALGCRDPVDRIDKVKGDDPERRRIVEVFEAWDTHHGKRSIKAADLAEPVRALVDPQGRGRQFVAARLIQLVGTRAGGLPPRRDESAVRGEPDARCNGQHSGVELTRRSLSARTSKQNNNCNARACLQLRRIIAAAS